MGRANTRRGATTKVGAAVGALIVVAGIFLVVKPALAVTKTPVPKITAGPSAVTASRTAKFTYKDTAAKVTFQCSIDTAKFKTCLPTGITYTNLAAGAHAFRVTAKTTTGAVSTAAARKWTIDLSAPVSTLTYPVNGADYGSAAWNAGCSVGTGVCGTASDPNGIASVRVAVLQVETGFYWNGSAFAAGPVVKLLATGTTSWRLPLPLPSDGSYRVSVLATDKVSNATALVQLAQFGIDTVSPAPPVLSLTPPAQTPSTAAQFEFTDSDTDVASTFECSLDGATLSRCTSPVQFTSLGAATHELQVVALDAARNASTAAVYDWEVTPVVSTQPFTIGGSIEGSLSPGTTQSVDLSFTNPNASAISVTSVTIVIEDATSKLGQPNPACVGSQNLVVVQEFSGPIIVPPESTATLDQLGVSHSLRPRVQMPDLNVNQDACKSTTFSLTYSGSATQASSAS